MISGDDREALRLELLALANKRNELIEGHWLELELRLKAARERLLNCASYDDLMEWHKRPGDSLYISSGAWEKRYVERTVSMTRTQLERHATMLRGMLAIGSAHAGELLTHDQLLARLQNADFRRRFNGPPPSRVEFESEEDARAAVDFERARKKP